MDEKIVKEKLEETISYNVSNEKKWYVRIIPLCVKWAALGFIFRRNDRAHTITLSNIGPISVDEEYRDEVEGFHLIIGVSKQQPVKCGICSYGEDMVISFTTVFADARLQRRFFGKLEADGVKAQFESNGIAMPEADQKNYPEIGYDISKWKKLVWIFYAVLAAAAVIVGVVNLATYSGLWWSVIAIFGMAYAGLLAAYGSILSIFGIVFMFALFHSAPRQPGEIPGDRDAGHGGAAAGDGPRAGVSGVVGELWDSKHYPVRGYRHRVFDPGEPDELAELFYVSDSDHAVFIYSHCPVGGGIYHPAGDGDYHGHSVRADSDHDGAFGGPACEK